MAEITVAARIATALRIALSDPSMKGLADRDGLLLLLDQNGVVKIGFPSFARRDPNSAAVSLSDENPLGNLRMMAAMDLSGQQLDQLTDMAARYLSEKLRDVWEGRALDARAPRPTKPDPGPETPNQSRIGAPHRQGILGFLSSAVGNMAHIKMLQSGSDVLINRHTNVNTFNIHDKIRKHANEIIKEVMLNEVNDLTEEEAALIKLAFFHSAAQAAGENHMRAIIADSISMMRSASSGKIRSNVSLQVMSETGC